VGLRGRSYHRGRFLDAQPALEAGCPVFSRLAQVSGEVARIADALEARVHVRNAQHQVVPFAVLDEFGRAQHPRLHEAAGEGGNPNQDQRGQGLPRASLRVHDVAALPGGGPVAHGDP